MFKISISDAAQDKFPIAVKAIQNCKERKSIALLEIIESLMKQTGLDPDSRYSLSYLQSALSLGKLRVTQSDATPESTTQVREEENRRQTNSNDPIAELERVFGSYKPE